MIYEAKHKPLLQKKRTYVLGFYIRSFNIYMYGNLKTYLKTALYNLDVLQSNISLIKEAD